MRMRCGITKRNLGIRGFGVLVMEGDQHPWSHALGVSLRLGVLVAGNVELSQVAA